MTKEQTINQLKLAAQILETGHPFEWKGDGLSDWNKPGDNSVIHFLSNCEIRPILATPPDGSSLHNPDNLTAEQVGVGYRLLLLEEVDGRHGGIASFWSKRLGGKWSGCVAGDDKTYAYRVPLSTPWPEAVKPKQKVPLEACDVPPGSVFRSKIRNDENEWFAVSEANGRCCIINNYARYFNSLSGWQINRSIPCTGKWNPDAWEACEKEA